MSGICGIVRRDGGEAAARDLKRQLDAMASRGPSGARRWLGEGVALGALFMRVTAEDDFDLQPLSASSRGPDRDLAFVCDARLDNREEIAAELKIDADTLARMADSAVLFAAYQAWGEQCVEHLIGDFVFAAWDGAERTLTLGRDHMGQRHLFFHAGEAFFAFATDRKGLWALPDIPRNLPDKAIEMVLVRGLLMEVDLSFDPAPAEGLAAVPGGSVIKLTADGAISARRYWTPHAAPEHLGRDEAYYIEAYRRVLGEAVACRVRRATAPVGLMLGGGFDSSAIAALAGPALAPRAGKLIAASCVSAVKPGGHQDPHEWVERCRLHMPHLDVRYVTQESPGALAGLERNFFASDSPHSENRFIGDALFTAVKAAGARVIMDGNGGDYTLNPRGKGYFARQIRSGKWRGLIGEWRARRRRLGWSHWDMVNSELLLYGAAPIMRKWRKWRNGLPAFGSPMPVAAGFVARARERGVRPRRPSWAPVRSPLEAMLRVQQNSPTVGWAATAAAHGMEFTQPFHDKRVVELGLAIPEAYHLRNGQERRLARKALADLYPPEFQTRRDGNDAFQPDFMDMAERFTPEILAEIDRMESSGRLDNYFDFDRMRAMLTRTLPGRPGLRSEAATRNAIRAFIWGRYIEWFTGGNS